MHQLNMEAVVPEEKGDQQSNDGEMQAEAFEMLKRSSFDKMGFKEELLRGINNHGFQKPTLLQERTIPPVMDDGRDVIVEAVSGTGKTSMIAILACQAVDTNSTETQVLILSPTIEMALEMERKIQALGNYMSIQAHACIGGRGVLVDDMCDNLRLGLGEQIVLGPRDRLFDLIKCGSLQTRAVKLLVLDEFDEIFSHGFMDQIYEFHKYLPSNLQVLLVATTLPNQIVEITSTFMTDPLSILINELPLEVNNDQKPVGTAAKPNGSFEKLGLKDELVRWIYNYGFQKPSLLQQKAILPIIEGRNVICQGEPLTGKTYMISLATCQIVDTSSTEVQALILSPTRNRALQLERQILSIGDSTNVQAHACFVGERVIEDMCNIQTLNRGVQILSGTPDKIVDLIERGFLRTEAIKLLVIDEFDEMHVHGFMDHIYNVYRYLPPKLQVVLVTATLPCYIRDITSKFMTDPVEILVKLADELTLEGIEYHTFLIANTEAQKFENLCCFYRVLVNGRHIIFCNSKQKVEQLAEKLREKNLNVSAMHEETPQEERDAIVEALKSAKHIVVVSTDVLAPGLDIRQRVSIHNYELPNNKELYIHRVGHLGRYEYHHTTESLVLNIFTSRELWALNIFRTQEGIVRDVHQHFGITVEGV